MHDFTGAVLLGSEKSRERIHRAESNELLAPPSNQAAKQA
jgi:hypothetical protein